jgi:hypothetical protein
MKEEIKEMIMEKYTNFREVNSEQDGLYMTIILAYCEGMIASSSQKKNFFLKFTEL